MTSSITPYFVYSDEISRDNAKKMIEKAAIHGVRLRPHVKTHKTVEIAHYQTQDERTPITVSTLSEVKFYLENGFRDITYAIPITTEKWEYATKLSFFSEASVHFLTDSLQVATEIADRCEETGQNPVSLFIKINSGAGRAGLEPNSELLLQLAKCISTNKRLTFTGLLTHAGQSYGTSLDEEKIEIAQVETSIISETAKWLENNGIQVKERSIGSSPTMKFVEKLEGITEIRPGNYIWNDVFQLNRGNCAEEEIGCWVVTSIIGMYPERNTILIDAGALALSKDVGFYEDGTILYGKVKSHPDWQLVSLSQEHGILKVPDTAFAECKVGDKVQILPNHSCLTAACFENYYQLNASGEYKVVKPAKFF